ncbi:MAG TPA: hypothetical protein VFB07_03690 [Vicinamibacterales bacterium]|nr:hypothetical protein [Vicinamibacterales bacterium]
MPRMLLSLITLALALVLGDARATELVAQARAALGGEKALSKIQGLSATGTIRRLVGDRTVEGETTLELQLPDKMFRTDAIDPIGSHNGAVVVTGSGINGDKVLRSTRVENAPPGAVLRTPPPPAPGSDAEAQALRNSRAELARMTIALLLTTPAAMPMEFASAGQAESPDGKADVLEVKGPNGFAVRLFLDASSHRPLMLTYRGAVPRIVVQTQRGGAPPATAAAPAPPGDRDLVDITMFLDDYRRVDGVQLPHHITRSVDGQPTEELTFTTIKTNPAFKADAFSGQ